MAKSARECGAATEQHSCCPGVVHSAGKENHGPKGPSTGGGQCSRKREQSASYERHLLT